jgi:probable DNA metabolism protein
MIACSPNPQSLLKAAILQQLTGLQPHLNSAEQQQNLFDAVEKQDADHFSLPELIGRISAQTSRSYSWIERYPGQRIALMILFNLRNNRNACDSVILPALAEALQQGPGFCICGRGPFSALFRRRSRDVGNEIHRMLGLIRFTETTEGDLIAQPKLFHCTADLLLKKFRLRYPGRRLIFLLPDGALGLQHKQLFFIDRQDLPASMLNPKDDFEQLWETYYRSQYIPERKNIRLASHFIPKKYWDWLPEGKILEQEAKN